MVQRGKEDRLEISGFILERTARKMKQAFQRLLKDISAGITADQWVVLDTLRKGDGLSQFEISELVFKDPPTLTRIIDLLCQKGLVKRKAHAEDRRRMQVFLTESGNRLIQDLLPVVREFRSRGWNNLSEEELHHLQRLLDRVFSNFE
jgi:DNA-binding MarR family transcriptional regulator